MEQFLLLNEDNLFTYDVLSEICNLRSIVIGPYSTYLGNISAIK